MKNFLTVLFFFISFTQTVIGKPSALSVSTAPAAADQRGPFVRPQSPTGEDVKGEQWLLTIGINTYLSWPRLKTATNDARALKNVLLERYHVDPSHVIELYDENATRKNILNTLRDLSGKINPDDSLVIFYAGHGHIDNITKKGSWIPVESGTDDPSAWISNQDIKDYLHIDAIRAKHVLLISDSCFSGDFFRGTRGGLPEVTDTVIKKAYQLSSRQAITSGGLEPVSDDGFGGNSVFSHFLVAALQNNTKPYLIPSELFPAIKSGVAQNAEQFPQLGSLYGVGGQDGGELVLFLKQENRLQNLSSGSAERQKELEQLKIVDAEASEVKQKEQAEIAKKQAEMDELDRQISEMRGRLGSGAARSTDGLDQIIAMAEQKEEQGKRLDDLRHQREVEERKRQEEIERLKREAKAKLAAQVKVDLAKYEKVASSKYAQDMKGAAWGALIDNYPDAKDVAEGDVDLFVERLGLVRDGNNFLSKEEKELRDEENRRIAFKQEHEKITAKLEEQNRQSLQVKSFDQGCRDFVESRLHELQATYAPGTNLIAFYVAGTPGGTCQGSDTTIEVSSNRGGPWIRIGQRENQLRRGHDDTIHILRLESPVEFRYVKITTPKCYTDCSAVSIGITEQEARGKVKFPRSW